MSRSSASAEKGSKEDTSSEKSTKESKSANNSRTAEEFEKLKEEYEAAVKRIARLERELVEYEIDVPPINEENLNVGEERSAEELKQVQAEIDEAVAKVEAEKSIDKDQSAEIPKEKRNWVMRYFLKWKGEKFFGSPKLQPWRFMVFSFIGAFLGIGILGVMHQYWLFPRYKLAAIIPSFGATAVLVFGTESPLAQPRSVIGGHVIAAVVGTSLYAAMKTTGLDWLTGALAVALSIVLMQVTKTVHPPAGATALIAVIGSADIKALGFFYIFMPTFIGALILVIVTLLVMNIRFRYPKFWL